MLLAPFCLSLFTPAAGPVLLVALFVAGVALPLATRKMAVIPGGNTVRLAGELRVAVTEGLQGAEELLLLGASDEQARRVDALYAGIATGQRRLGGINGLAVGGVVAAGGIALAVLLVVASAEVYRGSLSGPELVMMLLFTAASFEGIAPLAAALQTLPATSATAGRLVELSSAPLPVAEPATPAMPSLGHGIVFRNVSFAYGDGAEVLSDFSLTVPQGARVALTGPSGRGKSSIVELLLRFRPYRGSITIGGTELRDIAGDRIPELITAAPQRPHLFNGSIRANILLGAPDAGDELIHEALEDSGLSAWVGSLPDGLDTAVGVAGSAVSGGEARRIALARMLLHVAPIVLLDEPTEGLDAVTEAGVVARLKERLQGKTVLLITHRPACLTMADSVVQL
ncbi:MAG: ATP-binding cassette domain-containing protein, partial [Pseudomonadota bacterium]